MAFACLVPYASGGRVLSWPNNTRLFGEKKRKNWAALNSPSRYTKKRRGQIATGFPTGMVIKKKTEQTLIVKKNTKREKKCSLVKNVVIRYDDDRHSRGSVVTNKIII